MTSKERELLTRVARLERALRDARGCCYCYPDQFCECGACHDAGKICDAALKGATRPSDRIEQLEKALERLASMEAFDLSTAKVSQETMLRIDFASRALSPGDKQ